ncbi:MAG: hypothetical protein HY717_19440 [Planctomycetes bacterium]|nr:hypothetical protein [Planctomycetota bacterium]
MALPTNDPRPSNGPQNSGIPEGRAGDLKFFQDILQHTLVSPNPAETVTPEEYEALLEVARRHRGEPLGLDPIAVELVQAMLKSYFRISKELPELWNDMAHEIARTLYEDKTLSERLTRLWSKLVEAAP